MFEVLATLLLFPFALHPPLGWVVRTLHRGKRVQGLFLAAFAGLFYDLSINHLPFGFLTFFWIASTLLVETVRSFLFVGEAMELFLLTLFMAFTIQAAEAFYFSSPDASWMALMSAENLQLAPFQEALTALVLFKWIPQGRKKGLLYLQRTA